MLLVSKVPFCFYVAKRTFIGHPSSEVCWIRSHTLVYHTLFEQLDMQYICNRENCRNFCYSKCASTTYIVHPLCRNLIAKVGFTCIQYLLLKLKAHWRLNPSRSYIVVFVVECSWIFPLIYRNMKICVGSGSGIL